jgi:hypothetical protein
MSQKFFFAGWNELSPVQKTLVEEWVRAALRAQAAREALIKSYCDLNFSESDSYIENLSSEPFEIFGSQSTLEERKELKRLIIESPPDGACTSDCLSNHRNNPQELEKCIKECENHGSN